MSIESKSTQIVVVTPNPADGALAAGVLADAGLHAVVVPSLGELGEIFPDKAACLVLIDEALVEPDLSAFRESLDRQPPWSDLPLVLVAGEGVALDMLVERIFSSSGNVTLLQRPLSPATLANAVRVALRARLRQYEMRDLLAQMERDQRELERANATAESANKAKDEFLAIVSHELRTPLTAMLGWARLMRGNRLTDEKMRSHAIDVIDRNASVQAKLVEDLLDVSRIIAGKMTIATTEVNVDRVVRAAIESTQHSAEAKHISLDLRSEPLIVRGDPDRLQQIVWNLLSNAIKFTPKGGFVRVAVERVEADVRITVSDSGRGMEPGQLSAIFDRFHQCDSTSTRASGGLGLGLAIAKHLVELHQGAIAVMSGGEGRGATFTVTLPLAADCQHNGSADATDSASVLDGAGAMHGIHVLVVDDDADARELLETLFTSTGCSVHACDSAKKALKTINEIDADLLVSDIGMPVMNGYELIRAIRKLNTRKKSMPAIALTAFAFEEDRLRALEAGFHAHVAKPIEPGKLVHAALAVLDTARAAKA